MLNCDWITFPMMFIRDRISPVRLTFCSSLEITSVRSGTAAVVVVVASRGHVEIGRAHV